MHHKRQHTLYYKHVHRSYIMWIRIRTIVRISKEHDLQLLQCNFGVNIQKWMKFMTYFPTIGYGYSSSNIGTKRVSEWEYLSYFLQGGWGVVQSTVSESMSITYSNMANRNGTSAVRMATILSVVIVSLVCTNLNAHASQMLRHTILWL